MSEIMLTCATPLARDRCSAPGVPRARVADARASTRLGSFSCGGSMRGEPFADEDDRLAPFAQAAQLIAAPLSAAIMTWLRICSTVAAG